jgi:hypothetical protein
MALRLVEGLRQRFAQRTGYRACLCEAPLDAMFCPLPADVAQLVEQRFRNSRLTNCTSFRCFAYSLGRWVIGSSAFARHYAELRTFAAKILQTVENDCEKTPRAITADAENAPARVENYVPKIAILTATLASGASASFMPRLRRTMLSCRSRAAAANDSNLGSSGSLPSHSFSIRSTCTEQATEQAAANSSPRLLRVFAVQPQEKRDSLLASSNLG